MKIKIACPECGSLSDQVIDAETTQSSRPIIAICDQEEGGCDCFFAFSFNVKITYETFSLTEKKFAKQTV